MDFASFDWTQYWFMFPVAVCVASAAMLSGIGGAALFAPIFLIVFPVLGPEYPLAGTAAAIGAALLTGTFGALSGFTTYCCRKLIHFPSAFPFILVSVPLAISGALLLASLKEHEAFLKGAYALLMLVLAPVIFRHRATRTTAPDPAQEPPVAAGRKPISLTDAKGNTWAFLKPRQGADGAAMTGVGGFLTGLLGVGIGEVIMPQLVKRNRLPVPTAAAISVFVVIVTLASASFTQISALVAAGGLKAVPWNLVCYTIPGVIIGGQIGPRLQGKVAQRTMERTIATLFAIIGLAMGYIALHELGVFA